MYDVVIIGAGVAGALIADQLSLKGLKVVMLEAGPNEQDRAALVNHFFMNPVKHDLNTPYQNYPQAPQPNILHSDDYYVQKGPDIFYSPYNRRVGGTTWTWLGSTPRFVPNDFKIKTLYGYGEDWPIDYTELMPWYDKAEKELRVHHDFPQSCIDKWVNARLEGRSFESKPLIFEPMAQARDPNICCGSGICIPICPVQAKYDATIHVNKAVKQGATLIAQAVVSRLHTDSKGRITHASYFDWDKNTHTIAGKVFVLAAHAIESPKLLLQSANEHFPNGLANQSDQVGRNLMDHLIQLSYGTTPVDVPGFRGPLQTSGLFAFRDGEFRKDFTAHYTAIQNDSASWPKGSPDSDVEKALDLGLSGKKLRSYLSRELNRQLVFCGMCEQVPEERNRITLSKEKFDYYGLSRPEVHYQYHDLEHKSFVHMRSLFDFMLKEVGATDVTHIDAINSASHIMGTLRMGNNPKTSVVNKDCQTHEHENLYVAGASVFPSSGTANPTLTLSALSLKLADHLGRVCKQRV